MTSHRYSLLIGLLTLTSAGASASVITLDFNSSGGTFRYDPYFEDGFRVSSVLQPRLAEPGVFYQQHYDLDCAIGGAPCGTLLSFIPEYDGTPWLGTDNTSCRLVDANLNVLGFSSGCGPPKIRIDSFGAPFTPLSVLSMSTSWHLTSSKGGVVTSPGWGIVSFVGEPWQDIQWLELSVFGSPVGAPVGFDDLRVQVPEPGSLALLAFDLIWLAGRWAAARAAAGRHCYC